VAVNYSAEPAKDVVGATATGDIISGYTYSGGKQIDKPGLDIVDITTAIEGENLKVTMMLSGTPLEGTEIDWEDLTNIPTEFETVAYRVFFVKSTFSEPAFNLATPDMEYEPAEGEFYEVGGWLSWGYLDMGEFDTGDPVKSGNSIVWTISLADLTAAGITADDFQLFGQAVYNKVSTSGIEVAYDSAGFGAAQHVQPGDDDDVEPDDDDDDDGGFPIWIIIVIVIVAILVILAVVFFLMKGKKGEEEPEMPPESEMPMETEEMPMEGMEQPPMEGMEGMEQPPMPEQPVYEEQMPEQPVPEEPAPPVPEEPAPPMPEEPAAPPVPQEPAPPAAPPAAPPVAPPAGPPAPPQQPMPPQPPQE
jgi:hypothetical protein